MTRCDLFGCECTDYDASCVRCGKYYYEGYVFLEESRIWPLIAAWRWVAAVPVRILNIAVCRCHHCERLMWFSRGERLCSQKCAEDWIPF